MFIIWGVGSRQKVSKFLVDTVCENCGSHCHMNLIKRYKCGTIFFIPIIKANTKYFILCPTCGTLKQITKQEFKELNQQFKTTGNSVVCLNNAQSQQSNNYYKSASAYNSLNRANLEDDAPSMHTLITQDIDKQIERIKQKNYKLTPQNIERLKPALKQLLIKKYDNEFIVESSINDYFNHLKY